MLTRPVAAQFTLKRGACDIGRNRNVGILAAVALETRRPVQLRQLDRTKAW